MVKLIAQLQQFNAGRDPERLALKYRAMRGSPFAFFRGACHLFPGQLARAEAAQADKAGRLTADWLEAPAAWACGDLHLQNFGSYQGDNRQAYFDINDFDESLRAPATWDLMRLLTGVLVARKALGQKRAQAAALGQGLLRAYADALAGGKPRWVERETAVGPVRSLLDGLRRKSQAALLDRRTERSGRGKAAQRRLRIDGSKALACSGPDRAAVTGLFDHFARDQPNPGYFEVIDVARRIAGIGSLGVERYIVLVRGSGSPDGEQLLDLKRALPPSAAAAVMAAPERCAARAASRSEATQRWRDDAERIVAVERRMQAVSMAFLHAVELDGRPCVLRGLQPSEDKVALAGTGTGAVELQALQSLLDTLGRCLAWAQLRSSGRDGSARADALIDFAAKKAWKAALLKAAERAAGQVLRDAKVFDAAYDAGEFTP